jgi:hypothetical protein
MSRLYFGYCTRVSAECAKRFVPSAKQVAIGTAREHSVAFRAAAGSATRGYCHLFSGRDAKGSDALGVIYEHPDDDPDLQFPNYETYWLEVTGSDGKKYECYTRRLLSPTTPVRLPAGDWDDFLSGMKTQGFPKAYIAEIVAAHESAAPGTEA